MMRRTLFCLVNFEPVFMPALSPSMETGTVVEWKKKVGDLVKENEVFCTIQTDKAVVDYTNTFDPGYLAKIYLENGQSAPVAQTIAVMVDEAEDISKAGEYTPEGVVGEAAPEASTPAAESTPAPAAAAAAPAGATSEEPNCEFEPVFMPALSPSMETGTVVEWKKKVGDLVKENEVFCTVQTDKAVVDYTNTFDPGYLAKIYLENGQSAPVAQTIGLLVKDKADIEKVANYYPENVAGGAPAAAAETTPAPATPVAPAAAAAPAGATSEEPNCEFEPVFMPALSPSMETGTVVEWKKKVGDLVKENEVFCTVQTDKAVVDYTNTFDPGYLAKIYLENGQSAPVAQTIGLLVKDKADIEKVANYYPENVAGGAPAAAAPATPAAKPAAAAATAPGAQKRFGNSLEDAIHASGPSVIRIAAGLTPEQLEKIVPHGKNGRFLKSDFVGMKGFDYADKVTIVSESSTSAPAAAAPVKASPSAAPAAAGSTSTGGVYDVVLKGSAVKKSVDDSKVLKTLISTMTLPKKKVVKQAK